MSRQRASGRLLLLSLLAALLFSLAPVPASSAITASVSSVR